MRQPDHVGHYRVVDLLGDDGTGQRLLAVAPDGRLVAIELVHSWIAHDPGFRSEFRRGVHAYAQVGGVFTAAIVDADPDAENPWFATAFGPGPSLQQAIDRYGPLPVDSLRVLAAGLASALAEMHRSGLIHRGLEPSNVLLTDDGPRVIGFGIGRAAVGIEVAPTTAVVDQSRFMSPEQALSQPITPASDIFALGALLVAAATGAGPFDGSSPAQILYSVAHDQPDLTQVPEQIRELVAACLQKDPTRRPTPTEVLDAVLPIAPAQPWPVHVHSGIAEHRMHLAALADPGRIRQPALGPVGPSYSPVAPTDRMTPPRRRARTNVTVLVAILCAIVVVLGTVAVVVTRSAHRDAAAAGAAATSTTRSEGLTFDLLRRVDACELLHVLPPAAGLPTGRGPDGSQGEWSSCVVDAVGGKYGGTSQIRLTLGTQSAALLKFDRSRDDRIAGLPVGYDDQYGGLRSCRAGIPLSPSDRSSGVSLEVQDPPDGQPCEIARRYLGPIVEKLFDDPPLVRPSSGSLEVVDPCATLDPATLEPIIGRTAAGTPTTPHECAWSGTASLDITFTLQDWEVYGSLYRAVNVGGIRMYEQPGEGYCVGQYVHTGTGGGLSEVVEVFVHQGSCEQARAVIAALVPKLPAS